MVSNSKNGIRASGKNRVLSGNPEQIPVGVVGLGLMGTSITSCLLAAGHPVTAIDLDSERRKRARKGVSEHLKEIKAHGLRYNGRLPTHNELRMSGSVRDLEGCQLVIESILESVEAKRATIREIETTLKTPPIIGSNTSAIPVSILQQGAIRPERILGIHWGEPAHVLRFMEIICGSQTDSKYAEAVKGLAEKWGKEPSVMRRDIRGFITNRCFYAMVREALHLVESGYATVEDVDRSLRNDLGYWITFAGPFRFMDLTGVPGYEAVMQGLFPDLNCSSQAAPFMQKLVKSGAQGVSNCKGFYNYTPRQAKQWQKRFMSFTYEIRALSLKYSKAMGLDAGQKRGER